MPHLKMLDRSVQALAPGANQVDYFDTDGKLPGFGIRVSPSGTKTWFIIYRAGTRTRRLSLGRYPVLSLADARAKAKEALAQTQVSPF